MTTEQDRIRAYYASFDEWGRLDSAEGRPELEAARRLLLDNLAPHSYVLDLGGGPGRYTVELARAGHRVVLADLSPDLLERAREQIEALGISGVEAIEEANALDLGQYSDGLFDAVVAFGPFYHLTTGTERARAAAEIARVTRVGGLAFLAFIPYLSGLTGLIQRAALFPEQVPAKVFREAAESGVFHNAADSGFQEGYFAKPEDMTTLVTSAGFDTVESVSLRSITYGLERSMAQLDEALAAEVMRSAAAFARDDSVIATSGHVVVVARRR